MLTQIAGLYGVSWLVAAGVTALTEWAQLVRSKPLPLAADVARLVAMGWVSLPLALPALALLPLVRRPARG